jgi:hypothetical protein
MENVTREDEEIKNSDSKKVPQTMAVSYSYTVKTNSKGERKEKFASFKQVNDNYFNMDDKGNWVSCSKESAGDHILEKIPESFNNTKNNNRQISFDPFDKRFNDRFHRSFDERLLCNDAFYRPFFHRSLMYDPYY